MTTAKHPRQTDDQLRAEMKAAARKMWDAADIEVSPHLANAIRRAVQAEM
ncbi:hypothetical protein [Rhodococcus sp. JG-3]|nr:hypothetical protein [Rhodococcus sp. JG-3]